jgi:hypothetical protein
VTVLSVNGVGPISPAGCGDHRIFDFLGDVPCPVFGVNSVSVEAVVACPDGNAFTVTQTVPVFCFTCDIDPGPTAGTTWSHRRGPTASAPTSRRDANDQ